MFGEDGEVYCEEGIVLGGLTWGGIYAVLRGVELDVWLPRGVMLIIALLASYINHEDAILYHQIGTTRASNNGQAFRSTTGRYQDMAR